MGKASTLPHLGEARPRNHAAIFLNSQGKLWETTQKFQEIFERPRTTTTPGEAKIWDLVHVCQRKAHASGTSNPTYHVQAHSSQSGTENYGIAEFRENMKKCNHKNPEFYTHAQAHLR